MCVCVGGVYTYIYTDTHILFWWTLRVFFLSFAIINNTPKTIMAVYYFAWKHTICRKNSQKWDFGSRVNAFEILIMFPNCSLESHSHQQCLKMTDFLWSPQKSIRKHFYWSDKSKFGFIKHSFNLYFFFSKRWSAYIMLFKGHFIHFFPQNIYYCPLPIFLMGCW